MEQQPYRWSPEVERQFLALVSVDCSPSIIAEQIGCSLSTAKRLIGRHRAGQASLAPRPRPKREAGGDRLLTRFAAMSDDERNRLRSRAITHAARGWCASRIADALKLPVGLVTEWVAEWGAGMTVEAMAPEVVEVPDGSAPWWADVRLWPKVDRSHDDWPTHLRFEDDPRACRPEPLWRPVRTISDRMSYCSNATAWAAL